MYVEVEDVGKGKEADAGPECLKSSSTIGERGWKRKGEAPGGKSGRDESSLSAFQ